MKVTLREKPIHNGRKSLYLDFYPPILHPQTGKPTRREFLNLYVFEKPRLDLDRKHNKETRLLAENICAQRQLLVQSGHYGFLQKQVVDVDFLAWFKAQAELEMKKKTFSSRTTWMSTYLHLKHFSKGRLMASMLTEEFCRKFIAYLTSAKTISPKRAEPTPLAHNSAAAYYSLFVAGVRRAFRVCLGIDKNW